MIEFHSPLGERATPATLHPRRRQRTPSLWFLWPMVFPTRRSFSDTWQLKQLIDGVEVRVWNKNNASISSDAMLEEIQSQCDAVIAAYGH